VCNRNRKKIISSLVEGGQVLSSHDEKEKVIFDFYSSFIGTSMGRERTVNLDELHIVAHDLLDLKAPISEEEMWKTVKQLPPDKALRPEPSASTNRAVR
jgi:hypothetical protein